MAAADASTAVVRQALGTQVATAAKAHKAKSAAVAFVDLPQLSDADKVCYAACDAITVDLAHPARFQACTLRELQPCWQRRPASWLTGHSWECMGHHNM